MVWVKGQTQEPCGTIDNVDGVKSRVITTKPTRAKRRISGIGIPVVEKPLGDRGLVTGGCDFIWRPQLLDGIVIGVGADARFPIHACSATSHKKADNYSHQKEYGSPVALLTIFDPNHLRRSIITSKSDAIAQFLEIH